MRFGALCAYVRCLCAVVPCMGEVVTQMEERVTGEYAAERCDR